MNIHLMNVVVDLIEQRLTPIANIITRNQHITAMRDGFALAMPFVIVGSLMVPLLFPPVTISSSSFFGQLYQQLRPMLLPTFELTLGLVALIVAFGASASLAKQYQLPERLCGLTGCLSFLLFIGFRDNGATNIFLGGMGLFTALISSVYSIEIIRFFYNRGWCIRLPEEVPVMTRNGFQILIPLLVIMLSISVMNALMLQATGRILPQLISEALQPLIVASDTLTAVLISLFICNLLWFVGIHGALIVTGIMNPFWLTYLFENQRALAMGEAVLPHIYLQGFWDFYLLIGGIGSTLPLVFMAMRSRSRQLKSVGKIGLLPSLFNINEPILFGFPIIMNPVFLLPFIFVPLINACIAWYLTQLGVLDRAVAMLPWSMPSPLGAAWSANGSWKNMCMCLFAIFNAWMLYRPFFKVHERQLMTLEK
ncbi:PTS cellobiose transporter subunit IIC [Cronobacter sakazakii]|uniref:PTS cellobiose transporter subunit IIC n=1 Tax=Enterobacteriaceae TaxID=543 RepID=UPI000288D2F9|nr:MULTISPECIES: PTS cellobiose transporter subunit IIC [Enterobacteriaceae]EKC7001206.1 PTS cellobiose transporter subunit IIC [Cronobacter sakazakii]ELS0846606.1 PTS cellobiose transporter subunit IIC [Citrobacter freundii]HCB1825034.1 PTS cellobiose transporter subunit IIC [Citrobacter amalonaticus]HEM7910935.1 PTS cellobiose transporter subunit IIC [Citrobacter koseri]EJO45671.1 PTS system, lactose/cellobiose family IIC component [Enterobacter sp. SST3]